MGNRYLSIEERLWGRVDKTAPGGCWNWTGATVWSARGGPYGKLRHRKRSDLAHRVAWELANGQEPGPLHVLHRCDNPLCVNPDHLFLGTHSDNMQDAVAKGRKNAVAGERHPHARLTAAQVVEIRSSSESSTVLGVRYGVAAPTIRTVRQGRSWRTP